jgi:hypothetical protein
MVRRYAGAFAGCALLVGVAAGCTTARSSLGTSDSSCYLALPTATKAVNSNGRMVGVHRFTLGALRRKAPHLLADLTTTQPSSQAVCVVAFSGNFTSSSVEQPHGLASGRLAVVVSTATGNHLLGTVIFTRPPLLFGHSH